MAPTRRGATSQQKSLSEMSRDELADFIASNQAEIKRIEAQLASRAKDESYLG
ncbi:DUF1192 family protein [Bradyrhizobium sp. SBR1B]|uniref:DUF1192 family protein n=1 Tax=Bradyrhizobium sp. SBR1B TaxID=2663836 RepID=UPI001606320C